MRPESARPSSAPGRALALIGEVGEVLAASADERSLYGAVETALAELVGFRLLTILRATPAGEGLQRMHSSDPGSYPAQGVKLVAGDAWLEHLLASSKPQLSPDAAAVRRNFFDAEAIFALDCAACLNVPVRFQGRTLGTLNLLHRADWFDAADGVSCLPFANLLGAAWAAGNR